jgi:hypothetical protein
MIVLAIAATLLQTTKLEPVFGGMGEAVVGIRPHPEQKLGLYMRRSQIAAYLDQRIRQAANDPWIRVGETRTSVKEVTLEGFPCLLLESTATREIITNNPMEGQLTPTVERRISRTRRVWVADDGSIMKTIFSQSIPEAFTIEMMLGEGYVAVFKTKDGKRESGQIDLVVDPIQFENEYLTMAWGGKTLKTAKSFSTLDPFNGGVRTYEASFYGTFEGLEGTDRVSGVRVDFKDRKNPKSVAVAWVTNDGRLLQYDLPTGERLIVEPKVGEPGVSKVKIGKTGG